MADARGRWAQNFDGYSKQRTGFAWFGLGSPHRLDCARCAQIRSGAVSRSDPAKPVIICPSVNNVLSPVLNEVVGWHLDDEALREIDAIVARNVRKPVGPEFMAPPEHKPATAPRSSVV